MAGAPGIVQPGAAQNPLAQAGLPQTPDKVGAAQAGVEGLDKVEQAAASRPANPSSLSWQGNGPVSMKSKPSNTFGRNKTKAKGADKAAPAEADRGMAPQDSVWPLEGAVTSRFGWDESDGAGKRRWNSGITIAAPAGSPVRAILAGRVVYAGPREGYGNTVVLEHKDGLRSYYGNLQEPSLRVGDKIKHGADFAKIAAQPQEENSASLHFEMKKGEMALNPESAIRRMETASR
mgnify:CR=1 FL=1